MSVCAAVEVDWVNERRDAVQSALNELQSHHRLCFRQLWRKKKKKKRKVE